MKKNATKKTAADDSVTITVDDHSKTDPDPAIDYVNIPIIK